MPDDLPKKVIGALTRKSVTPEDELQAALEDMARDIALIEPNPLNWGEWVSYLLDQVEAEAKRRGKRGDYGEMLRSSQMDIDK
jgi:hypothetical protein